MPAITMSPTRPAELGTAVITLAFTDEDGITVVPTSLAWQLTRTDGTVVNSRTFALGTFTGVTVVLSGNDLAMFGSRDTGKRVFSVQGVYDSTAGAGTSLPLKAECEFSIEKLLGQVDI